MAYGAFALIYDALTADVEYDKRAEYILSLFNLHWFKSGGPDTCLLDLACGTGSLALRFRDMGFDVIGVDGSPDMLSLAREKLGPEVLLLCQDMAELDLYGTVNAAVCSLDSLNHITDKAALARVFERVSLFLEPGGVFVFDMNTPYKHREVLGNNTFAYEAEGVFCVWRNEYRENDIVNICLDIFMEEKGKYARFTEEFSERAYGHEEVLGFLEKAGFKFIAAYDDMSLNPPGDKTERVYYVAVR